MAANSFISRFVQVFLGWSDTGVLANCKFRWLHFASVGVIVNSQSSFLSLFEAFLKYSLGQNTVWFFS